MEKLPEPDNHLVGFLESLVSGASFQLLEVKLFFTADEVYQLVDVEQLNSVKL